MALYKDLNNAVSDKYYTQPLPQVAIPIKKPVNAGPTYSDKDYSKGPYIQNFNIPGYYQGLNNNISTTVKEMKEPCPKQEILYRYGYELHNLNNGKVAGGFDRYNINNIPSCTQRNGNYAVFSSTANPFSLMMATDWDRNDWYRDSHSN